MLYDLRFYTPCAVEESHLPLSIYNIFMFAYAKPLSLSLALSHSLYCSSRIGSARVLPGKLVIITHTRDQWQSNQNRPGSESHLLNFQGRTRVIGFGWTCEDLYCGQQSVLHQETRHQRDHMWEEQKHDQCCLLQHVFSPVLSSHDLRW